MQTFTISNLEIAAVKESADRICYVLYPFDSNWELVEELAHKYDLSIVAITGMDWDNDLTPWHAKGEPPGSPDFKGNASKFLSTLLNEVLPETERRLGINEKAVRTLTGVSLSGLFTLWQWMTNDTFQNIISLSGSFWYDGLVEWIKSQPVPKKTGKAYFLLGNQEAKTNIKAFQPVRTDTEEIVKYLHAGGINDLFEIVPGNHYQYGQQRLEHAFFRMFGNEAWK